MVSKKGIVFSLLIDVLERDGHCFCASKERIKPMWIDDLLWDILDMPENKNEPVSLRAIGAFTVYGSEIYEAEECDKGSLCNKGIWSNAAMIDYCKNKLS